MLLAASSALCCGLVGIYCSAMIYIWTRRPCWAFSVTHTLFWLSTLLLGSQGFTAAWLGAAACSGTAYSGAAHSYSVAGAASSGAAYFGVTELTGYSLVQVSLGCVIFFAVIKLLFEGSLQRHFYDNQATIWQRRARLMQRHLRGWQICRIALGIAGGMVLPAVLLAQTSSAASSMQLSSLVSVAVAALLGSFFGELCERHLFFIANVAPRMPGGTP
jgi:DMSO reductase anchor subunit